MSRVDDIRERAEAARQRHGAWYGTDATNDATTEAEWPDDLAHVESYELDRKASRRQRAMAHEIVREDIPTLLDDLAYLLAELDKARAEKADAWYEGYWARADGSVLQANPYRVAP